ncbi:MAG: peptidylprolyl isomerase [Bacteroidales bacterium]|nr:peptidylprolyl isomerase [Bacteroidales bacterium]
MTVFSLFRLSVSSLLLSLCLTLSASAQSVKFEIHTNMGVMRGFLYDDTPGHRDKFVELARSGHFDGTLFYRCVKDFVIQGGSSDSRNAKPGQHIGYGSDAVNIDSEFKKNHFHKRGALCAPRQPDKMNLFKTSDISQFYIVCGRTYTDEYLTQYEKSINLPIKKKIKEQYLNPRADELRSLRQSDPKAYNKLLTDIRDKMDFEYRISNYKEFTPEQRQAYTSIGGTPQLDNEYTVFGEITEGLDVMEKISLSPVDNNSRPLKDIKMTVKIL